MTTTERPPRPNVTPDMQALFDAIIAMDEHNVAIDIPEHAGRYKDQIQAFIEACNESSDVYQQERAHYFNENGRIAAMFAMYGTSGTTQEEESINPEWETSDAKLRKQINDFVVLHAESMPDSQYQFELSKILCHVECTDTGNGIRFAARFGHQCKYVPEPDKFYTWNGKVWSKSQKGEAVQYAKGVGAFLDTEINVYPEPCNNKGETLERPVIAPTDTPTTEQKAILDLFATYDKKIAAMSKWKTMSRSAAKIAAMLECSKSETGLTLAKKDLDADDHLVCFLNGVLDLHSRVFRKHNRKDFMTRSMNVNYVADATCPKWDAFLFKASLSRPNITRTFQQIIGLGLSGESLQDLFSMMVGNGGNGKSVAKIVLLDLFGSYAATATRNMFMEQHGDGNDFEYAGLDGVRLLFKDETKLNKVLDMATVKALTGGEPITACFKFKEHFTYSPKFTPVLSTNFPPVITEDDEGIWRRVKQIPWNYKFEKDPDCKPKEVVIADLRTELEGIAQWAIQGYFDFIDSGSFYESPEIVTATTDYKRTSDRIGAFLEECCYLGSGMGTVTKKELYPIYRAYAEENGMHPLSKPNFGDRLKFRGIQDNKTGAIGWHWENMRLRHKGQFGEYDEPMQNSH